MQDVTIELDDRPGALAEMGEALADAGVNIEVLYSDHDNQLILVADDLACGRDVSAAWMREVGLG